MTRFLTFCACMMALLTDAQSYADLSTYLEAVLADGFGVELAVSEYEQTQNNYRLFKSDLRPQIQLNANLPTFSRTSTSVVQPNGSLSFQSLNQNLSSVTLTAIQPILFTGGQLIVEAGIDRFDDFGRSFTQYNGVPLRIGYAQSLVGFNAYKWQRKMEKERLRIADKQKIAAIHAALAEATEVYFDALIARTNLSLSESNRTLNEKLLQLAEERLALGKISLDEKLQMASEYTLSALLVAQAKKEVAQTELALSALLTQTYIPNEIKEPSEFPSVMPPLSELKAMAIDNSVEVNSTALQLEQWRQETARRKAEAGIKLQVYAASGLVRSGNQLSDVYTNPFSEQQIQAGITVPLVDWGRRSATKALTNQQIHAAELNLLRTQNAMQTAVHQLYLDLQELSTRLELQTEVVALAEQRYTISTERYTAGKTTLTEWVLAQRNRDQAKRDYLVSLRDFYLAYCTMRSITGFDIKTQSFPTYQTAK